MKFRRWIVFFSGLAVFACTSAVVPTTGLVDIAKIAADAQPGPFPEHLKVCPGIRVQNAPEISEDGVVETYPVRVRLYRDLTLAAAPVEKGCLASGFGMRALGGGSPRQHQGVDIAWAWPTDIYAAGDGVVVDIRQTPSYGKMLILDHGRGIYTRYAHFDTIKRGLSVGDAVKSGDVLGVMGTTASPPVPRHLHYEILKGEFDPRRRVNQLEALDVFSLPRAG